MVEKSPKVIDEPGAQERFDRGIKNALAMPPKPRQPKNGDAPSGAPKAP